MRNAYRTFAEKTEINIYTTTEILD